MPTSSAGSPEESETRDHRASGADETPLGISRRRFLRNVAVAAGVASVGPVLPEQHLDPALEEVAAEHEDDPALLIDLTKCIGCGTCLAACKLNNHLEWQEDQPARGPDAALASSNWSVVQAMGAIGHDGELRYVRRQCMHCLEPACASACFVKALRKTDVGPVTYDADRCVGCRYCLIACPFGVPSFDWEAAFGRVEKCDFCYERTSRGKPSICAEACPVGALTFGKRGALLAEAWRRIREAPKSYIQHVYGETEVGGTSMLYVSDVPFDELGFHTPRRPLPEFTWEVTRLIPPVATGLGATLIALYLRRRKVLADRGIEETDARAPEPEEVSV